MKVIWEVTYHWRHWDCWLQRMFIAPGWWWWQLRLGPVYILRARVPNIPA